MQAITQKINAALRQKGEAPITVYQLDRMIWLVCTGNFYLHDKRNTKAMYIGNIQGLN